MPPKDPLSVTFSALADPTRRDILNRLRRRPLTVSDLAKHYPMSRAAVSQHLSVLERAELVRRNRRGQWIDCAVTPASLDEAARWIEKQRAEWNDRLDRLEDHLGSAHPPRTAPNAAANTRPDTRSDTPPGPPPQEDSSQEGREP